MKILEIPNNIQSERACDICNSVYNYDDYDDDA